MGEKTSLLGLIISFPPYLRSAMVQFPLNKGVCRTAPGTTGRLNIGRDNLLVPEIATLSDMCIIQLDLNSGRMY